MEWKLSGNIPCLSLISLGTFYNNKYEISKECLDCLREINAKLNDKGPQTYQFRRALIFMDIFNKDLIPILIHVNHPNIIRSAIKLLVQMTLPVGCLVGGDMATHQQNSTSESQVFVHELNQFLGNAKETFALNPLATRSIFEHLNCLLADVPQQPLSKDDCESVGYFILLIRNIMHAPERIHASQSATVGDNTVCYWQQRRLLWDLFSQGFDLLLIDLLTCSQKDEWVVTIAQLITLIFKDHSVEKIQKLLLSKPKENATATSLPSSSDDDTDSGNCSQTSSYNSATETVNETSDSTGFYWSRNPPTTETSSFKMKNNMESTDQTEIPDTESGYEKRKKILTIRRSRAIARHVQTKVKIQNYTPSEDEISQLLKDFAVDFLLNGYNALVGQLYQRLLQQDALPLFDRSYFLWLISYFLPIASHLELDIFKHLKDVISVDIFSYLAWEIARESEIFEMNLQHSVDLQPGLRRMHFGLKAIRECLQSLEAYSSRIGISQGAAGNGSICEEQINIYKLRCCLAEANDLRQLFLLQLRQFNPIIQSQRYLCDVITTNHVLLRTLEQSTKQPSTFKTSFDFRQHLKQFCSKATLRCYGLALEDFRKNDPFVNDCIFTLLHHVGIYLGQTDLLCDPIILRSFGKIWKEEFIVCDEWNDLIELIVNKFMRQREANGYQTTKLPDQEIPSSNSKELSPGNAQTKREDGGKGNFALLQPNSKIEFLLDHLVKSGFKNQLNWIQSSLLTACSARLGTYAGREFRHAIICLSLKMNVSCPIVPWTELEASTLRSKPFVSLLHHVGLSPYFHGSVLYPRIPHKWSADILYSVALFFGPVDQQRIDFDLSRVRKIKLLIPVSITELQSNGQLPEKQNSSASNHSESTPVDSTMKRSDSLEVQRHDSSDDEEMEYSESNSRLTISPNTTTELRVPLNWAAHPDTGRQMSSDNREEEEPFRMASIRCEISRMSFDSSA